MIAIRYADKLYEARRFDTTAAQEIALNINDPRIAIIHWGELIYRINTDQEQRYKINQEWILLCPIGCSITYNNVDQLRLVKRSVLEVVLTDSTDVFQLIPPIECHNQELKHDPPAKPFVPTMGSGVYIYGAPGIPNSTVMYAISFPSDQAGPEPKTPITTTTWTPESLAEWGKNSSTELKIKARSQVGYIEDVDAIITVVPDDQTLSNDVVQIQNVELKGIVPPKKEDE